MLRECPVTPYAADRCGGCGVPVVRQWPRARFRRAALASVALHPHGQRLSPAPLATPRASARRHHQLRGVPRSPRGHKNPRGSRLAVWFERARLRFGVARRAWGGASARTTSRWIAIWHLIAPFGAHVGVSRPRCRWQLCGGGTIPPRHESLTGNLLSNRLAATGPEAAFGACHYPLPEIRPFPPAGVVTGARRSEPPLNPRRPNAARGASRRPRPAQAFRLHRNRALPPRQRRGGEAGAIRAPRAGLGPDLRCDRNRRPPAGLPPTRATRLARARGSRRRARSGCRPGGPDRRRACAGAA